MTAAALFDWDGTLLDSREVLLRCWHTATAAVADRTFPASPAEEALVFTRPGSELFPPLVGHDRRRTADLLAAFQAAYEEHSAALHPFPGVVEMLGELREGGVAIGVVTSKGRGRFTSDAADAGLDALVDVALCMEDTEAHKPDPAPVLAALEALGAAADRAVMVGDTPVDVGAGLAAGTAVLGVAWGATAPDALLAAGAFAVAADPGELGRLVLSVDHHDPGRVPAP
jgi:pyrophosphatase PpaX